MQMLPAALASAGCGSSSRLNRDVALYTSRNVCIMSGICTASAAARTALCRRDCESRDVGCGACKEQWVVRCNSLQQHTGSWLLPFFGSRRLLGFVSFSRVTRVMVHTVAVAMRHHVAAHDLYRSHVGLLPGSPWTCCSHSRSVTV